METLKRTNNKEYLNGIQSYILDCINLDDYSGEGITETLSDKDKINYLFAIYKNEYCYDSNVKRYPNNQERFKNWISGAPSVFNIAFENYEILQVAKKLHEVEELTEKQEDTIIENFFNHIALHALKLKSKLNK